MTDSQRSTVVICPTNGSALGRRLADEKDADLIVDDTCPPGSVYVMTREDYERGGRGTAVEGWEA